MKVVVCVDERGGVSFFRRRQSRDAALLCDLASYVGTAPLYCAPYSEKMLKEAGLACTARADYLSAAEEGAFCFTELDPLRGHLARVEEYVLYRWNRDYPADRYLDADPEKEGFSLAERTEFAGNSHEKITREVYRK